MAQQGGTDVVSVLMKDHREVEAHFQDLEKLPPSDHEWRRELTEKAITELVRHSVAEEAYLYPAAREKLPDGDKIADHDIEEHAEAERTMKELERTDASDPRYTALLEKLMSEIRHHVHEEETELFPMLERHADAQELQELGRKVENMKKVAPTRPHPSAPDKPPADKLLAPVVGLVDRLRDAFSGRPH